VTDGYKIKGIVISAGEGIADRRGEVKRRIASFDVRFRTEMTSGRRKSRLTCARQRASP
jgi:hypothetical protein